MDVNLKELPSKYPTLTQSQSLLLRDPNSVTQLLACCWTTVETEPLTVGDKVNM